MVATLMKKNTNFVIESVNTDTTVALPPIYMGIDNKIYAKVNNMEEESDDGRKN